MTLPRHGLDYDDCSEIELKQFMQRRGVELTKSEMVAALRNADLEASFRFFDLIPELRNMIYKLVIEVEERDQHIVAKAAILFTCKQAYAEASGLLYQLYEQHVFTFNVFLGRRRPRQPYALTALFNGNDLVSAPAIEGPPPTKLDFEWPSLLGRIRCLSVSVHFGKPIPRQPNSLWAGGRIVHDFLHQLNQFLAKKANIVSLRIKIFREIDVSNYWIENALSPVPAMASRYLNTEFSYKNVRDHTRDSLEATTEAYRTLRSMEDRIRSHDAIKAHVSDPSREETVITYDQLILPDEGESADWLYMYATKEMLKESIKTYNSILEKADKTDKQGKGSVVKADS